MGCTVAETSHTPASAGVQSRPAPSVPTVGGKIEEKGWSRCAFSLPRCSVVEDYIKSTRYCFSSVAASL